jgi:gluconate:H+ symporter, GntP family
MWLVILLIGSVAFIVVATSKLRMHPFLALLFAAFGYGILSRAMPLADVVQSVNKGFGGTIGSIGIVILAGSIIGTFLERSGGALALAERTLKVVGEKRVPAAMGIIGYVVSIPVFCDSGFVLLSPLNKALSRKAKTPLAAGAVALALGLYATHTMVPPTPGPVAAAAALNADLGLVILWGLLVSGVALVAGWLFAVKVAPKVEVADADDLEQKAPPQVEDRPGVGKALLPILVPIILIVLRSICQLEAHPFGEGAFATVLGFLGLPVVALLLGVLLAFLLPKRLTTHMLATDGWLGQAVVAGAGIIIITGAGGAFGKVLQNAGIAGVIEEHMGGRHLGIWLPFLLAAALKTAQGSSTVAIITTANIMAPLLVTFGLDSPTARALVVVSIGAGSMVVSHANDSFFWVVTQFTGLSVSQGYRLQTLGTLVEGGAAMATVWLLSVVLI